MTPARFREYREQMSFTQKQLATYMAVSEQAIGRWERGVSNIPGAAAVLLMAIVTDGENLRFMLRSVHNNN